MLVKILILLIIPVMCSAGTIVQTGHLRDGYPALVWGFDSSEGLLLTSVSLSVQVTGVYWHVSYGAETGPEETGGGAISISSGSSIYIDIYLPGMVSSWDTSGGSCSASFGNTSGGSIDCGGSISGSPVTLTGDPNSPEWAVADWLNVGYAATYASATCEASSPCYADVTRANADVSYRLTYTYTGVPEPAAGTLVPGTLAAVIFVARQRKRRRGGVSLLLPALAHLQHG